MQHFLEINGPAIKIIPDYKVTNGLRITCFVNPKYALKVIGLKLIFSSIDIYIGSAASRVRACAKLEALLDRKLACQTLRTICLCFV